MWGVPMQPTVELKQDVEVVNDDDISEEDLYAFDSSDTDEAGTSSQPGPTLDAAGSSFATLISELTASGASFDELRDTAAGGGGAGGPGAAWDGQGAPSLSCSMPLRSSSTALSMASSVPIAIPGLSRWPQPAAAPTPGPATYNTAPVCIAFPRAAGAAPMAAAPTRPCSSGFVPPHCMTGVNDFCLTAEGGSPSACLKREKLRTRNAILRKTGFL